MGKKLNTDIFIEKTKEIHGEKYNYSLVEYKNFHSKVKIICEKHGIFEQEPSKHLMSQNCPRCAGNIKNTSEEFIDKAKIIHGNRYDYSLVDYKNSNNKIKIICKEHGIFEQIPSSHLIGCGCAKCSGKIKFINEDFIKKSCIVHDNKYDYSLVEYVNAHNKVKIICKEHGIFEQEVRTHLNGGGCPTCSGNKKHTTSSFIKKSREKHDIRYDYSLSKYINNNTNIKIICKKHGIFEQLPFNHMKGCGCPKCYDYSAGEKIIEKYLLNKNIKFETQKQFNNCKFIKRLKFDFYLLERNLCIEFDGDQHFNKFRFEHNEDGLNIRKKRDEIKNIYCEENNIKLLRIKYTDNIENKLKEILNDN